MPPTQIQLEAVEALAVGVVHVQLGNSDTEFPTTSTAHPSWWVWLVMTPKGPLWSGAEKYFPLRVRWDIWDKVVIPIIQNPENQFLPNNGASKNYGLISLLDAGSYEELVEYFSSKLVDGLKAQGFLPPDLIVEQVQAPEVPQAVANPEEVQQQAELEAAGGTVFLKFDAVLESPTFTKFDE